MCSQVINTYIEWSSVKNFENMLFLEMRELSSSMKLIFDDQLKNYNEKFG